MEAGETRWYLHICDTGEILEEAGRVAAWVRSGPETARLCSRERGDLLAARAAVKTHIKNTYLKQRQIPLLDAPCEVVVGWMEINRG
jgi:hypothetical protein